MPTIMKRSAMFDELCFEDAWPTFTKKDDPYDSPESFKKKENIRSNTCNAFDLLKHLTPFVVDFNFCRIILPWCRLD